MRDDLGPEKILNVYDPHTGMKGIVVIDNTTRGPAKGGIRMTPTVHVEEVTALARAMTLKTALADLPLGGGKSGIIANSKKLSQVEKEIIVRSFARAIKELAPSIYVAAPDIAMAETEMGWIADEIGKTAVTGKPVDLGGIPHELGSTGYGVYVAVRELLRAQNKTVNGKTVAVQGFGNVGSFAAQFLEADGAILVAASDSSATLYDAQGIDVNSLKEFKKKGGTLKEYGTHDVFEPLAVLTMRCDILIPAAQKHVITKDNFHDIKAKIVVQGANIPIEEHVEKVLELRGIMNIPDILANAGGVISSYIEQTGGIKEDVFPLIEKTISQNVKELAGDLMNPMKSSREACIILARKRLT